MKQAKVVLVGIGGYGLQHLKEVFDCPDEHIQLVGVVDSYPERCLLLDEVKARRIPIYASMEACYREQKADLTVIATPIYLHTEHILKALAHGSNVLCEKPLCSDEADIEKLQAAQKAAGRFVCIGYQWAYSDAVIALKQDILDGKFGAAEELRVLLLRPRPRSYFARGLGWAGKIKTAEGKLVYDSVANNSAAHYLFNMLYILGEHGRSAVPTEISAELLRANAIENFDVCNIQFRLQGAKARFIAAHPVDETIETIFEYRFEEGLIYCSARALSDDRKDLMPADYEEIDQIVAYMKDGSKKVYGSPNVDRSRNLHIAAKAAAEERYNDIPCGIEATAVHTRLINEIQKKFPIYDVKPSLLTEQDDTVCVKGLVEAAVAIYKDSGKSLLSFGDL